MASSRINGTTVVFSNANLAISETDYTSDASLNTVQYLDILGPVGGDPNTILWSIGTSQIGADGWTTLGALSIPTELLAQDTAYNIDSGASKSALGANIFLTGATGLVGYDMSAMSLATKTLIDNLGAGQSIADSFDYAIRTAHGIVSWNTVTVVIAGAAAQIEVTGGSVQEGVAVDQNGNLHDTETISVRAASGDATAFTITPANRQTLGNMAVNGDGSFTYMVSDAALLATHMGYGESWQDWFTVATANGTTLDFYETVYGNIHTPEVTATAAQARIRPGQSVALSIAAQDNDDNAQLSYFIAGVPAGVTLSSAADPSGALYDPAARSWAVSAAALKDLTLTAGPGVTGQIHLVVTVINTETNPANANDVAVASASATIDITVDGNAVVHSGTTAVGGRFEAGSTQLIEPGGIAISAFIGTAGTQDVSGTASGTTVFGAGEQIVEIGGNAVGTIISNGAFEDVRGTASGTMVVGGGTQLVEQGGIAQSTFLADNAAQYVYGSASGTVVRSGGIQIVSAGGIAALTLVDSGGVQVVSSAGVAQGTTISTGGFEAVTSGGVSTGTMVGSGGLELVLSGAAAVGTLVRAGGSETVNGSEAEAVVAGGTLAVMSGGVASRAMLSSHGVEVVSAGGIARGTLIGSGGSELVLSGGASIGSVVQFQAIETVAGTETGAIVTGGVLGVNSGGVTNGVGLGSGAFEVVSSGGIANGTMVGSGSVEIVSSGGASIGSVVQSGGLERVDGTETGAIVAGGTLGVNSGGITKAVTIGSGGFEVVSSGGMASGTLVGSGGFELILSGGTSIDATISGGLLRLQPGAAVAGGISFFGSGGIYEIDGSTVPANTVFGFAPGDVIDFAGVAGGAADTVSLGPNNLLTILDQSSHAYSLHLDPAQNFSGQTFFLRDDGHGGTSVNLIGVPHI